MHIHGKKTRWWRRSGRRRKTDILSHAMRARQSAKSPRVERDQSPIYAANEVRSMGTTRRVRRRLCRRRDRVLLGVLRFPALSSRNRLSPYDWRKATSLLTCISADYLRLYTTPMSIHISLPWRCRCWYIYLDLMYAKCYRFKIL